MFLCIAKMVPAVDFVVAVKIETLFRQRIGEFTVRFGFGSTFWIHLTHIGSVSLTDFFDIIWQNLNRDVSPSKELIPWNPIYHHSNIISSGTCVYRCHRIRSNSQKTLTRTHILFRVMLGVSPEHDIDLPRRRKNHLVTKQINHASIIRPFALPCFLGKRRLTVVRTSNVSSIQLSQTRTCNGKIMISQFLPSSLSKKSVQFESQFRTNLGKASA